MNKKGLLIWAVTLFLFVGGKAQTGIDSPYSQFGLGELHNASVNATVMGMGGIGIGFSDPTMINPANPASYMAQDSMAFMFELGIFGNSTTYKTTTLSESGSDLTLNYVTLGFPVTPWYRMALGVLPYSKVGYDVQTTIEVSDFSNVVHSFNGTGGLNQVFWGHSIQPVKNLRLGVDITYLFGQSSRSSMIYFPDSAYIFGTKVESKVKVGDFIFDYGVQWDIPMGEKRKLTLGAVYANAFHVKAKRDYLSRTLMGGYDDLVEYIMDTIEYRPDEKGNIIVPERIGGGFSYVVQDSWLIGADFEWQNWANFKAFGQTDSLNNAWRVALGGQYQPKHTSISSLFRRMTYRMGGRYNHSYLSLYGQQINEFAVSFGIAFPMKKSKTGIDLAIELGKRGTTKNNLIQENFFNFSLGISIQESWFYKRQYQ